MAEPAKAVKLRGSILRRFTLLSAVCVLLPLMLAGRADAGYTHLWEHDIVVSGETQPQAVDGQGNVYLYSYSLNQVIRVDRNGNPVDFSALGTNVIDGMGNEECATTPSDCDQVPINRLEGNAYSSTQKNPPLLYTNYVVAVDDSGGVADGYIYVMNTAAQPEPGRVEVFAPTGRYLGEIDPTQIGPENCKIHPFCSARGISVDSDGHIYLFTANDLGIESTDHVDQFVPVDGFPGNDEFVGQLRRAGAATGVAGRSFTYAGGDSYTAPIWRKFSSSEYQRPSGFSVPVDFSPEPGPFGDAGIDDLSITARYLNAGLDARTEDIYLLGNSSGNIHEYDKENNSVGPVFGLGHIALGDAKTIAVDPSPGPSSGMLYVKAPGPNHIAVFGPTVPLPEIITRAPAIGHTTALLHGSVDLNGGGDIDDCHIEYGFNSKYGSTAPCDPPAPYGTDTDFTVNLTGLLSESNYHYRVLASDENGTEYGPDQIVRPKAVLGVETRAATGITGNSAELRGFVNPDGFDTQYHFEYGINTVYGHSTPSADAGSGAGGVEVTPQEITQLQPGRTYHYRLVASNELGTTKGEDRTFVVASKPAIGGVEARNLTGTSVELRGQVDPGGYATTYHFDYGTTANYGSRMPATEASLGAGYGSEVATVQLSGLQPDNVYHYRVVAENQWGVTVGEDATFSYNPPNCPNSYVRQETSTNTLPDCRAYEIVSPEAAGGLQLSAGEGVPNLLADAVGYPNLPQNTGDAMRPARFAFFGSLGAPSGAQPPNSVIDMYVATRTDTGWKSAYPGIPGDQALFVVGPQCSAALDLCYDYHLPDVFVSSEYDPSDTGSRVPYLWDSSGKYVGRLPTNAGVVANSDSFIGASRPSPDFSHFAFSSINVPFAAGGVVGAPGSVYDNDIAANTVSVASLLPSGDPIPRFGGPSDEFLKIPAVSDDGSHILISAQGAPGTVRLFMRVNGTISYDVSRGHDVKLLGATADGSKVVFSSRDQVTADDHDASIDLFMWSEQGDAIARLSSGNGEGDTDDCVTQWEGVSCSAQPVLPGRSTDDALASRNGAVLFYSPESLDPNRPAVPDERNLYLYRDQQIQYVATLDSASEISRVQVSPNGDHAAFLTDSGLPGYDNAGHDEMYAYNANTRALKCVSCVPSGAAPGFDVRASASGRFMADDGRAFFSTKDPLVPRDTNGLHDVYEFVDGRAQLISAGTGQQDSSGGIGLNGVGAPLFPLSIAGLESVSHDGVDVYFSTFDSLVPQDHNGQFLKFYDARTNGGFHYDPPPLPCTAADECHGGGSQAPAAPVVGSGAQLGAGGNLKQPARAKKRQKHAKRKHRRQASHRAKGVRR